MLALLIFAVSTQLSASCYISIIKFCSIPTFVCSAMEKAPVTEQEEHHVASRIPFVVEDEPVPQIHAKTVVLVIVSQPFFVLPC